MLGHVVLVATQLSLPPAFIARYGIALYGQWLVLSAAVGFLTSLNFGLQTFAVNELTMHYHRGHIQTFHTLQSSLFRVVLGIATVSLLAMCVVFFLPLSRLLQVTLSNREVAWTVYFLGAQLIFAIVFGQLNGVLSSVGLAYAGGWISSLQRLTSWAATLTGVWLKLSFSVLAGIQLFVMVSAIIASFLYQKRRTPDSVVRISYWEPALLRRALLPSLGFGLFTANNFLLYQVPLIALNRVLGSGAVVVFSISRTVFSFARLGISLVQASIAPEVTRLYGTGDKRQLLHLYRYSEAFAVTASVLANFALFAVSPFLLRIWLHNNKMFDYWTFGLMMLVSCLMGIKEYKVNLQYATNNHMRAGIFSAITYAAMAISSFTIVAYFGIGGLLVSWILVEIGQIAFIDPLNRSIVGVGASRPLARPVNLIAFSLGCVGLLLLGKTTLVHLSSAQQVVVFLAFMIATGIALLKHFDASSITRNLWQRTAQKP